MKLSNIELTDKEVQTLRRWLVDLDRYYEFEAAMKDEEAAEHAQAEERALKLVANARECADLHGEVRWMLPADQAEVAWKSWLDQACYMDIDEHFSPDDYQKLWEDAYANRLAELRRAA